MVDFSKLTRLDVSLRDENIAPGYEVFSAARCPLLAKTPALAELYLRFTSRDTMYSVLLTVWA